MVSSSGSHEVSGNHAQFCIDYVLIGDSLCSPIGPMAVSFGVTLTILLLAERFLSAIEDLVKNTQYESVKNKVFQEMTGIGLLSFLTLLIDAGSNGAETLPAEYLSDVHHADVVIFIMSVLYLGQISTHMYLSYYQWKKWRIASGIPVGELVASAKADREQSPNRWWWFGMPSRDQMEYKILLSLFCKKFNIRKTEFNFPAYLNECFRHYIIGLIDNSFFVRIVFGMLIGLNVIRVDFFRASHHRADEHCGDECQAQKLLLFFACCGWALIVAAIVLVMVSRMYEWRLLCCAGIRNYDDYAKYLLAEEDRDLKKEKRVAQTGRKTSVTLNKDDLKNTLQAIKEAKEETQEESTMAVLAKYLQYAFLFVIVQASRLLGFRTRGRFSSSELADLGIEQSDDDESEEEDEDDESEDQFDENANDEDNDDDVDENDDDEFNAGPITSSNHNSRKFSNQSTTSTVRKPRSKRILSKHLASDDKDGAINEHQKALRRMSFGSLLSLKGAIKKTATGNASILVPGQRRGQKGPTQFSRSSSRGTTVQTETNFKAEIRDISKIFMLNWPALYFVFVQIVMFLHGAYCSFYLTNFAILPPYTNRKYQIMWHVCILLPVLLMVPLMRYVIKVSSVVSAMSHILHETVAKVMEDDDAAEKACQYLRTKLVKRLATFTSETANMAEIKDTFISLVDECDKERHGYINRSGFRFMLRRLNLHFTDARFNEVMDVIDSNFDEKLTAEELFQFVYPDAAASELLEKRIRDQTLAALSASNQEKSVENNSTRKSLTSRFSAFMRGSIIRRVSGVKVTPSGAGMTPPGTVRANELKASTSDSIPSMQRTLSLPAVHEHLADSNGDDEQRSQQEELQANENDSAKSNSDHGGINLSNDKDNPVTADDQDAGVNEQISISDQLHLSREDNSSTASNNGDNVTLLVPTQNLVESHSRAQATANVGVTESLGLTNSFNTPVDSPPVLGGDDSSVDNYSLFASIVREHGLEEQAPSRHKSKLATRQPRSSRSTVLHVESTGAGNSSAAEAKDSGDGSVTMLSDNSISLQSQAGPLSRSRRVATINSKPSHASLAARKKLVLDPLLDRNTEVPEIGIVSSDLNRFRG